MKLSKVKGEIFSRFSIFETASSVRAEEPGLHVPFFRTRELVTRRFCSALQGWTFLLPHRTSHKRVGLLQPIRNAEVLAVKMVSGFVTSHPIPAS